MESFSVMGWELGQHFHMGVNGSRVVELICLKNYQQNGWCSWT